MKTTVARLETQSDRPAAWSGQTLQAHAIEAQGGMRRWRSVRGIDVQVRARFPLLMLKGVAPRWHRFRASVDTQRVYVRIQDYPRAGMTGHFAGLHVWVSDADGVVRERQLQPAPGLRVPFSYWWDDLDMLFFLGYAMWNYKNMPFLFAREGFVCRALAPCRLSGGRTSGAWLYPLEVQYPADIPTHCARQIIYFDETGLLRRLDYRAEVIGRLALGAHLCSRHRDFDGLIYPTYREVRGAWLPRYPLPFPKAVQAYMDTVMPRG